MTSARRLVPPRSEAAALRAENVGAAYAPEAVRWVYPSDPGRYRDDGFKRLPCGIRERLARDRVRGHVERFFAR